MEVVHIPCLCPPRKDGAQRHPAGDTITLKETLDFRSVTAIRSSIGFLEVGSDAADIMAVLTEGYLHYGIDSWSLVAEDGKARPVSRLAIDTILLSDIGAASIVGDAADEVFGEKVMLPLVNRAESFSLPTPTEPTSAPRPVSTASSRSPKPSKPSSTTTTPTDGTGTTSTSRGGASSSSQNSVSAA
jgi:hypothetical protein